MLNEISKARKNENCYLEVAILVLVRLWKRIFVLAVDDIHLFLEDAVLAVCIDLEILNCD